MFTQRKNFPWQTSGNDNHRGGGGREGKRERERHEDREQGYACLKSEFHNNNSSGTVSTKL